jgi:hypothetical protein
LLLNNRLRVLENRISRKYLEQKREEITEGWRRLPIGELKNV